MSIATIIPFDLPLPQQLPIVKGNADYESLRNLLMRIDKLLISSGLESQLLNAELQRWAKDSDQLSPKAIQNHLRHTRCALRCNIARVLLRENYRGFAARLADSPLLQHFCGISSVDGVRVPSKTTLQRYSTLWQQSEIRNAIAQLLLTGADCPQQLLLAQELDLENVFMDTTSVTVKIHYPVDWVLLRDATRSLMRAVELIRQHGLKHRMEPPMVFVRTINRLCIQMCQAASQPDSQRKRKRILRQMDKVVEVVRAHAQRHRDLLDRCWEQTDWTRAQAQQVLDRIDRVLELLPKARKQARQRILEGKPVADEQKLMSLYEPEVKVIVRNKAGTGVEFGNTLFLAENSQGLILDWELFRDRAPADSELLPRSIGRMEAMYGTRVQAVAADRGFDSQANQIWLAQDGIYNGVCPRSPAQLKQRARSWKFKRLQKRRAQTEGRVGILKHVFLDEPVRCKGFDNRQLTVAWAVLVHNLWVIARMPRLRQRQAHKQAA